MRCYRLNSDGFPDFKAKIIIDATGNGLVALKAGVPMKVGREEDGLTQPVSLMFTLSNVDDTKLLANGDETYDTTTRNKEFIAKTFSVSYSGMLPASAPLVRLYRSCRGNECIVNATHVNYIDGTNLNDIEKAELELREQIPWIIHYLRSNVPGFENCRLARSSMTLGVRESYRIVGEYTLTEETCGTENASRTSWYMARTSISMFTGFETEGSSVTSKPSPMIFHTAACCRKRLKTCLWSGVAYPEPTLRIHHIVS